MKKKVLSCSILLAALCLLGFVLFKFRAANDKVGQGNPVFGEDQASAENDNTDSDGVQENLTSEEGQASTANDKAGGDGIKYTLTAEELASTGERLPLYEYFAEGSIIYSISRNNLPAYYRYYPESKENVFLGTIPNYYIGLKGGMTRVGNRLYFFGGVQDGDTVVNRLFCIDLNENTLEQCSEYEDQSLAPIQPYHYKDGIVTLKNIRNEDGSIRTFIDFYDPERDEWVTLKNELWKSYKEDGVGMALIYATKEKLYVLQDEYMDSEEGEDTRSTERLLIYDEDMKQEKDYIIGEDIREYFRSIHNGGRPIELSVNGDLLFIKNMSTYEYIGILREDHIETMLTGERSFFKIYGESEKYGDGNLFYQYNSNILYLYDEVTSQLLQISLDLKDGEPLWQVFVDGDDILIVCSVRDEDHILISQRLDIRSLDSVLSAD